MSQFSEPIGCALCGLVFLSFDFMFLAGVSLGIAGFASACLAAGMTNEGE